MAEETKVTEEIKSTPEPVEVKTQYEIQLKELSEQNKNLKAAQSGSDRMVSELKKELDELRKSSMSDKERIEYEKKLAEQDRLSFEREKAELAKERLKFKFIADAGIDSKIADFISAETEEGLKEQVAKLNAIIDAKVKPLQEEIAKLKAELGRPGGGTGTSSIDWKKATVAQINSEYIRIKKEQGEQAAKAWLATVQ
jgi:hypothetical protein